METTGAIDLKEVYRGYDPNEGAPADGAKLPSTAFAGDFVDNGLAAYVGLADRVIGGGAPQGTFLERVMVDFQKAMSSSWDDFTAKASKALGKAVDIPASFLTFGRMTYMPDSTASNVLPWPGVHPEALRKIVQENVAPNLIIGMRVDDVINYSQHSAHLWKPGWRLETITGDLSPSPEDKKKMLEAQEFLFNSATRLNYTQQLDRDKQNLTDFQHFLAAIVRDTLTFDLIALSTDRDQSARVAQYAPIPAGNIRLVGVEGYEGDKEIYAVAVDEGGAIRHRYRREELALYVRNARTDPEYSITMTRGYGTPEITTALKLIQIFQNVLDFNADVFQRSGVPHGMLVLTGNSWTQKQVDVLTRMWHNLKRGITKALALPVLAAPKDGKVEIVDFSRIKGDEAFYQDLLNLSIGCFCAVFRFPVHRLGYRISGHGKDSSMNQGSGAHTSPQLHQEDDKGLTALLLHIENFINQVLIWPRWAGLKFVFTGKNPKEDAREYEARRNALTWDEARAEADLPKLVDLKGVKGNAKLKELAEAMGMSPIDPNLSGIYQTLAAAILAPEPEAGEGKPGNSMQSKKDPASSEDHGGVSGVRRDSAAESSAKH